MEGIADITFSAELHELFRLFKNLKKKLKMEFKKIEKWEELVMEISLFSFPLVQEGLFEGTAILHPCS